MVFVKWFRNKSKTLASKLSADTDRVETETNNFRSILSFRNSVELFPRFETAWTYFCSFPRRIAWMAIKSEDKKVWEISNKFVAKKTSFNQKMGKRWLTFVTEKNFLLMGQVQNLDIAPLPPKTLITLANMSIRMVNR